MKSMISKMHCIATKIATQLALAAATLFCPLAAHAQGAAKPMDQLHTLTRDELDVVKVLTQQEHAWNDGDIDGFAKGFKDSPDILFVGQHVNRGYEGMLADYKRNYPSKDSMGTLSYSELEPHVLDAKYAVLLGQYHVERGKKEGGSVDGFFSMVLEKTDKGWKIIVDHTT